MVKVSKGKNKYSLINNSKDYHNNFDIKKNNKIIFKKNFHKNKSRIFAPRNFKSFY